MINQNKSIKAYTILVALVICGLLASAITASKVTYFIIDFPFSNVIFSIFTYPIVDCICELWGKSTAQKTVIIALAAQVLFVLLIQLSIAVPHASFWHKQSAYEMILNTGSKAVIASVLAFLCSQLLDIFVYQKIKNKTNGRLLWLRSNLSTFLGQLIDSLIFVSIIFYTSSGYWRILLGSVMFKIVISFVMTPFVYLIVFSVNRYLSGDTLAFKVE